MAVIGLEIKSRQALAGGREFGDGGRLPSSTAPPISRWTRRIR